MNALRGWAHSISGIWNPSVDFYEEREDALRKVRHYTAPVVSTKEIPVSKEEIPEKRGTESETTGRDEDFLLRSSAGDNMLGHGIDDLQSVSMIMSNRRHSMDSIDTGLFEVGRSHSTPKARRKVTIQDIGPGKIPVEKETHLDMSTLTSVTPLTREEATALKVSVPTKLGPWKGSVQHLLKSDLEDLPLDTSILTCLTATDLTKSLAKLKETKDQLRVLEEQKENYLLAVQARSDQLEILTKKKSIEENRLRALERDKLEGKDKLDKILSESNDLVIQVSAARGKLSELLVDVDKLQQYKVSMLSDIPAMDDPLNMGQSSIGSQSQTPVGKSVLANQTLMTGSGGSVNRSVYIPVDLSKTRSAPIPAPRCRDGLTPIQRSRYEANPAIAHMCLDTVARDLEELAPAGYQLDFGNLVAPDAARQKAVEVAKYTGQPWRKYLGRYKSVVESNRWNNQQALIALKGALIGGIGDRALEAYNEKGDKTLQSLLDCAEWALNKVGKHDPRAALAKRVQKKDEHFRVFGFAIQELVADMYQGCRADTPVVIQEMTTRFVNGIRDTDLQNYLREKWQPKFSLVDLFELADVYETKASYFPSLTQNVSASVSPTEEQLEVAASTQKGKKATNSQKKVSSVTNDKGMEDMIVSLLKKHTSGGSSNNSGNSGNPSKKGKGKFNKSSKNNQTCRRCQKKGHYASDCKAPAPVPFTKTDTSDKSEN